jgi:hypothetical protein
MYLVSPMINGLSDHDLQLLIIKNIDLKIMNTKFQL